MKLNNKIVSMRTIIVDPNGSDPYDCCDAFIEYAEYMDGTPLTEQECEILLQHDHVQTLVMERVTESTY